MSKNTQLYIPEKLKVGFDNRGPGTHNPTFTGKIAYVIYYDHTGKLRKETSWENWRNKDIPALDLQNEPTSGFVLNKAVGGVKESYGWDTRKEYIRVYDPRDFEFEISLPNLLFILRECACTKGASLEGEFVYAWDGTELVLLPTQSADYQKSKQYTGLQSKSVQAKELVLGYSYLTKKQEPLVYLGKLNTYFIMNPQKAFDYCCGNRLITKSKTHTDKKSFIQTHIFQKDNGSFYGQTDMKNIAMLISDSVVPDYAERIQQFVSSPYGSQIVKLELRNIKDEEVSYLKNHYYSYWAEEKSPGVFALRHFNYSKQQPHYNSGYHYNGGDYSLTNQGLLVKETYNHNYNGTPSQEKTQQRLVATSQNGNEFFVLENTLVPLTSEHAYV